MNYWTNYDFTDIKSQSPAVCLAFQVMELEYYAVYNMKLNQTIGIDSWRNSIWTNESDDDGQERLGDIFDAWCDMIIECLRKKYTFSRTYLSLKYSAFRLQWFLYRKYKGEAVNQDVIIFAFWLVATFPWSLYVLAEKM